MKMKQLITGYLVFAQAHETNDQMPETEGHIELESCMVTEQGRTRSTKVIYHQIAVPTGLMDSVMPHHWNNRVTALVQDDLELPMYTLITIDPAEDDTPDGVAEPEAQSENQESQLTMAPPLQPEKNPVLIQDRDEVRLQLLINGLMKDPSATWESSQHTLCLWPDADYMSHNEIAHAVHHDLRHVEEDSVLVISEDDGILLDYHMTRITADVHLAMMHSGWADHANLTLDIDDVPGAALLIQDLHGGRTPELDAAARLQLLSPHLETYLDRRMNDSPEPGRTSFTLWSTENRSDPQGRQISNQIEEALANHTGLDTLVVPLPDLQLRASVIHLFANLWLATVNPTQIDLKKRIIAVRDTPVAQLLLNTGRKAA